MSEPLSPWARVETALAVLAVDPAGVKGLWLRARAAALRDRVAAALPLARRLHPNVDDVALYGGVDLAGTLASGHLVQSRGLLATDQPVVLTMAERCPPGLAARLARWLDDRGPCVIALDEGAEPEEILPSALADRLGLFLDLDGLAQSEATPLQFDADRIAAAQARLAGTVLPETALPSLAVVATGLGIASLRAPLLALAAARALAAWRGEAVASESTLQQAAELVLAHRGTPPPEVQDETAPPPPPPDNPADPPDQDSGPADRLPDEMLLDAVRAALPPAVLARLAAGQAARSARGSGAGASRKGNHRGRPLAPRPGMPGAGRRIDLVATLRAAAPWQPLRARSAVIERRLHIRPSDLRLKRYQQSSDRVLIFAVDASGSAALARLAEAKGAVELLLAEAYARRDHVALIAFRGAGAEVILPPTRSLVQTKRRLAGLPGGGGTPLAAGLRAALDLGLQARARGLTPTIALLTDGRGNIALDGSAGRDAAEADALRLARALNLAGFPALVIDIANRPQPGLRRLADSMAASYLALPRADAHRLSAVLQGAMAP